MNILPLEKRMSAFDRSPDKCPGCYQTFKEGDLTQELPEPGETGQPTHRWHIACHQRVWSRLPLWRKLMLLRPKESG